MLDSFYGEVYFRVSKHLSVPISVVIRNKFHPDYKMLIHKYAMIIKAEQEEYSKIKNKK